MLEWWPLENQEWQMMQALAPDFVPLGTSSSSTEQTPPPPAPTGPSGMWIVTDPPETREQGSQTEGVPVIEEVPQVAQVSESSTEFVVSVMEQLLRRLFCPNRAR